MSADPLGAFDPLVGGWFRRAFAAPTPAQTLGWPPIAAGEHTLIVAPTGSGKTLAAFLGGIDRLLRARVAGAPAGRILYLSPLKALNHDVERNLRVPLAGLAAAARREGRELPEITVAVRTGDTPQGERQRMLRHPPDILITTPESLYLLLTSRGVEALRDVERVIVDEIHAVAATKRGAHLALSLERLQRVARGPVQRIGLSATQRPLDEVARFLGGRDAAGAPRPVTIVDAGTAKAFDLRVIVPVDDMAHPVGPPPSGGEDLLGDGAESRRRSIWPAVSPEVLALVRAHRSTLVFVNNRRLAERMALRLNELAEEEIARAHHGSLAREQRVLIEEQLKAGTLPCLVATSSLELGIDMGAVDLVIQVESPRSVARGIQRVGRAGHRVGEPSRGRIFPKHRGDLLECAAVVSRMLTGDIEATRVPRLPLDVLAQQVVAICADPETPVPVAELHALVRGAEPFHALSGEQLESVLDMLTGRYPSDELAELRPRLVWDRAAGMLRGRAGARRLAVVNAGTIPDRGLFPVVMAGDGARVGELEEEMVYEARTGQTVLLGASTWRIEEITRDRVVVSPAPGLPALIPFWKGDGPGRPVELGRAVGRLARELAAAPPDAARQRLREECAFDERAAGNLVAYLAAQREATGAVPSDRTVVVERFRDEVGDWRVCVLTPFGARAHAPWAMALQARHRQRGTADAHVLWTDDGIAVHLPDADEPPGADLALIDPADLEDLVVAELGSTALFGARFRENAARALLIPRRRPGLRTPLWQQRLKAASLLQVARRFGSFPIVLETYRECLDDWLDLAAAREVLGGIASGKLAVVEVETTSASPFAASLLFEYVATYMYEDDTPVAERRAAALLLDRDLLRELLGQEELRELIDPEALALVEDALQGRVAGRRATDADTLHDLLRRVGDLTLAEAAERCTPGDAAAGWLAMLRRERRACTIRLAGEERWIAAEDAARYRDAVGTVPPRGIAEAFLASAPGALGGLLARYARTHGPFPAAEAAARLGLSPAQAGQELGALEQAGALVRGGLRPGGAGHEWCDPDVLRRLRRASVTALRREVEPVDGAALARFLPRWHGIGGGASGPGTDRLREVIGRLQGLPLAAGQWEEEVFPSRLPDYQPSWLDRLLGAGDVLWAGAGALGRDGGRVALYLREEAALLGPPPAGPPPDGPVAAAVRGALAGGAAFWDDIADVLEAPAEERFAALWALVWAGEATNDLWLPLRVPRRAPTPRPARRPVLGRRALGVTRLPPSVAGRWSLLAPRFARGVAEDDRRRALAELLLERHGVLTRPAVLAEGIPGGYARLYGELGDLETLGRCRRGHFVERLGGAQFALPGAVARLRDLRDANGGEAVVIGAADPAQPYGAALPWPARPGRGPTRAHGARVVLLDGTPILHVERGGRSLLRLSSHPETVARALAALAGWVGGEPRRRLRLERVDGAPALDSDLAGALAAAGFRPGARGYELGR